MTRLFLVRHAESEWNADGRWQGRSDPPLSERGREQALAGALRLGAFIGPLVSSPLRRALETAEIMGEHLGLDGVVVEEDLSEVDVGEWSGLTNDEVAERYPEEFRARREGRLERFPGGEALEDFRQRVRGVLVRLAEAHGEQSVLVVTHGGVIAAIERMLGVHPGAGLPNLGGRWFVIQAAPPGAPCDGPPDVRADGDRVLLLGD